VLRALLLLVTALSAPQVTARIETGLHPCGAAAGFGAVWVANDGSGSLARVNPRTNRVNRRIGVGRGACSADAGAGFVWVTNYKTGSLVRVDPRTLRTRKVRVGRSPFDVVVAGGRVWSTTWRDGRLVELDPSTLRIIRRLAVGSYPTGLLELDGSIWVGFGKEATAIARVDPTSGQVTRVPVGVRAPSWFAVGTKDLWVTADDNALVHVDPRSARVLGTARFGRTLAEPAVAADGTIWVPDKEIDKVFRIAPATGRVIDSFPGGDGAFHAFEAFDSMWVTSYAGTDVWRFKP
jgi:streptogramin lyase